MAQASIPVDLFNPGQVFACMGFLEAADILLGNARGGFEWPNGESKFSLHSSGDKNPFAVVLEFLGNAEIRECGHKGYKPPPPKGKKKKADNSSAVDDDAEESSVAVVTALETFPASSGDPLALPVRLVDFTGDRCRCLFVTHWTDGSSRNDFKLYSGNRSAASIARAMLQGTGKRTARKPAGAGAIKTRGLANLWKERCAEMTARPFEVLTSMGGSFNFDPRGAWTAIDAGYSPNDQKHAVEASPVVEMLAAIGLDHARPDEFETRDVRYGVWNKLLPPVLARPALAGARFGGPMRVFRFTLNLAGKNKVVTFSREETNL
jgi:CRISPR-associated protein Csx14